MLRVRDIIAFAPMLGDLNIEQCSIFEGDFFRMAKWWRRTKGLTVPTDDSHDAHTKELINKVNALTSNEPNLTFDETIALLYLLYGHRQTIPTYWANFCTYLKDGDIPFNTGLTLLTVWTNLEIAIEPPGKTLDRLFEQCFITPLMTQVYAQCTQQPLKQWTSVFELNKAFVNFFSKCAPTEIVISNKDMKIGCNKVIVFPDGWIPELSAQLVRIKDRANKI